MSHLGLFNTIPPNRVSRVDSGTLIDHIWTNFESSLYNSDCIDPPISDHKAVFIIVNKCNILRKELYIKRFNLDASLKFSQDVQKLVTDFNNRNSFMKDDFNHFITNLANLYNKNVKTVKVLHNYGNKPWINSFIRKAIKRKYILFRIYKLSREVGDKLVFNNYRNYVRTLLRKAETKLRIRIISKLFGICSLRKKIIQPLTT